MATGTRTIYRSKALQHYAQSGEKVILPRFVAPPIFLFLWILLGLLVIATWFAWLEQFPTRVAGSGLVLDQGMGAASGDEAIAVIFLPATPSLKLRAGEPIQVQIGSTGPQLNTTIASVEPGVMSPSAVRQRYDPSGVLAATITQPSYVLMVQLGPTILARAYAGSLVSAQVQVGSQRVLSLLPGLGQLIGA